LVIRLTTYRDQVTSSIEALTSGLRPFVAAQMQSAFGASWIEAARSSFRDDRGTPTLPDTIDDWDAHALLTVMWDQWNQAFRNRLSLFERSLVAELRAFRNRWAHQQSFNFDDTYRLLDSVQRLLTRIPDSDPSAISELKFQLLRDEFGAAINAAGREAENRHERWAVSLVYLLCGSVFIYLVPKTFRPVFGEAVWAVAGAITVAFMYLIYQRLRFRPVEVGPRECRRCRRIIYGTTCPYCTSASVFDSAEFLPGRSSHADDIAESPRTVVRAR